MKDRILELAKKCGFDGQQTSKSYRQFEAFYFMSNQDGQRAMRERAANECEAVAIYAHTIRNLEIE